MIFGDYRLMIEKEDIFEVLGLELNEEPESEVLDDDMYEFEEEATDLPSEDEDEDETGDVDQSDLENAELIAFIDNYQLFDRILEEVEAGDDASISGSIHSDGNKLEFDAMIEIETESGDSDSEDESGDESPSDYSTVDSEVDSVDSEEESDEVDSEEELDIVTEVFMAHVETLDLTWESAVEAVNSLVTELQRKINLENVKNVSTFKL